MSAEKPEEGRVSARELTPEQRELLKQFKAEEKRRQALYRLRFREVMTDVSVFDVIAAIGFD